ncbi:hypothetical protein LTR53_019845, partial [Teratosphaeriaceae sp. CCFEE 6253]
MRERREWGGADGAAIGEQRLQDLGADAEGAGAADEGQVHDAAAGGLEDPIE